MLVYLKFKEKVIIYEGHDLLLRDIADIVVAEAEVNNQLQQFKLGLLDTKNKGTQKLFSIDIIQRILENFPDLNLDLIGKDEINIEIITQNYSNRCLVIVFTLVLAFSLILIVTTPFQRYIYYTGLALGLIIFFYSIGKDIKRAEYDIIASEEFESCYQLEERSAQKDK
ncbi:stage V sporulation protein AA [Alkalicella caledoniensis]|uniref:Stage V sporulation protein AA n=1 Tax=Alkalicella caledoniensis TaxID=2731377 RepID=A0A7G9WBZ3_ALKCA|nr:stage V sporulation protein AA [Alkalicella caledoniensis]QNO16205.1 stage V sporulation protein AA [Alkalicella caledoniensis]